MRRKAVFLAVLAFAKPVFAVSNEQLLQEIERLQKQSITMQKQIRQLQKQVIAHSIPPHAIAKPAKSKSAAENNKNKTTTPEQHVPIAGEKFHSSALLVHAPDTHPESIGFYPTALVADNQIVTYIAGTPVVSSPYLGERPAFDGSDYIVNISSINRDIRLMQQRRRLYRAYQHIGYPQPNRPIIAISGKSEPVVTFSNPYSGASTGDATLGSSELDVAAALNNMVEAFIGIAYDESPPYIGGPRISNSSFNLNLGFVNIGDLDKSPVYFTAGQLYAPYGKYASAMISSPLTLILARTKTRPFILGYKTPDGSGPFAAIYGFITDTTIGRSGVGGVNLGYTFEGHDSIAEIGGGYIGSIADSGGMQNSGSLPGTTFGGFGSITNGTEAVRGVPGANVHGNISFDRYTLAAEWVGATQAFRPQDLSFNGRGAKPQAAQFEGGVTFKAFDKPASVAVGYQWSKEALALNIPQHRISGVFNISIWKDTVESLEYRHDIDYKSNQFANGAAPPGVVNANTTGTGGVSDTLVAQIGVYF
ncbi:LbtU family siderophore porin [Legionella spiritensis]|uniref:Coiled-coil protein n=1 Tax=Legionella spiritensis TaxID=452 RepID=A0A0W0ZBA0_LEGSP|nr:LbtU family siderophore porin [Legionella spiritensis]KTD66297.1 coiled-coil protein [Legionella spiritensis]SNV48533.1 coiled-coil protein [Legionella spiritensis]